MDILNESKNEEDKTERRADGQVKQEGTLEKFKKISYELQEFIMILVLLIMPFFSISYVNLVNLCCGIFLVTVILNVKYYLLFHIKKFILTVIFILNMFDIILRIIVFFLFFYGYIDYKVSSLFKSIDKFFNVHAEDFSKASYHIIISMLITSCLLLYQIIKSCEGEGNKLSDEYIFNIKTLKLMHSIRYFLLLFTFALLTLSATLHQSLLFLFYMCIIILNLVLWAIRSDSRRKRVQKISVYVIFVSLIFFIIIVYLFNTEDLYQSFYFDEYKKCVSSLVGVIYFYEPNEDSSSFYQVRFFKLLSIWMLEFVLITSIVYLKSRDYKIKVKNYKRETNKSSGVEKKKIVKSSFINKTENGGFFISDADNMILIEDEKSEIGFFTKARLLIQEYIYSPYFIMHLCRIGIIIWFSYFKAYTSIVFILWLFKSFTIKVSNQIYFFTSYVAFPFLIWSSFVTYLVNITGIELIGNTEENKDLIRELGMIKYESDEVAFIVLITKLLVTYLFGIFIYIHRKRHINGNSSNNNIIIPHSENKNEINKNIITSINVIDDTNHITLFKENNLKEPLITNANQSNNSTDKTHFTLTIPEILLKLLLSNMEFLTMFFIYIVCFRYVSIFHLVLTLIFFFQLIKPDTIKRYCKAVVLIIEVVVFTEYFWIFISNKITLSEETQNLLNLIFLEKTDEKNQTNFNDQFLWGALYCMYIEYQNYNSKIYEIYENKKIDFFEYVYHNFEKSPRFVKFMTNVFNLLNEIYIWSLFFGYFSTIVFLDTSLISGIKLIAFFVIIDKYIKIIESNYAETCDILRYINILIRISITLSLFIYAFQFLELQIVHDFFKEYLADILPFVLLENSKLVGFEFYKQEMRFKFLPHCASNLISVMIYREIYRIILKKKTCAEKKEHSEVNESNILKYFYKLVFFVLKYYWISVFLIIFLLSIRWRLAISMFILQVIFLTKLIQCFLVYFNNFILNCEKMRYLTNFNSMLSAYSEEKAEHFKMAYHFRTKTFRIIWIVIIVYITLTYFLSIVIDMKIAGIDEVDQMLKGFIRSSAYLAGLYHSNLDVTGASFFKSVYGYILILLMLIVEKYFQNKCFDFYANGTRKEKLLASSENRKKLVKINHEEKDIEKEKEITKEKENLNKNIITNITPESIAPLSTINDFKKVNDPLSLVINQNPSSVPNPFRLASFKTDLKKLFEEDEHENEAHRNKDKTGELFPKARTLSLSRFVKKPDLDFDFNDAVLQREELKGEFIFPDFFGTDSNADISRPSIDALDIKEINNVHKINNEEVMVAAHSDSSEEDKKNDVRQHIMNEHIQNIQHVENAVTKKDNNIAKLDISKVDSENEEEEVEVKTRKRKNASYKKQILIKYSLEFQTGIKKVLEEVIVFLILLSAILKLNILSFVDFMIVVITYKSGNKLRSIFYLACIYLFFFGIQYALFTSNLSNFTDTNPNLVVLRDVSEYLSIPWYERKFGYKWGLFFSLGVTKYQINSLWIDLIIIIFIYFYLEFFSFAIFEMAFNSNSNKITFSKNENSFKRLTNFTRGEYEKIKKSMKVSFDIEIQGVNKNQITEKSKEEMDRHYFKKVLESKSRGKTSLLEKEKNNLLMFYKTFKRYIYLTFHNVTLIIILIFSMMNNGIISIPYIIFSVVFIYKTHNFLVGNQWTFLHAIKYLLKPILFLDLIGQLIYQIPFEFFILHRDSFNHAMSILGFEVLINYNTPAAMLNIKSFSLTFLKIITYFLVSIQEIIYNSNDFKMFILKYHLKMKEKSKINGKLHAFIFNNSRIMLMNERLKERREIDDTLNKIELQLNKWNEKLNYNTPGLAHKGRALSNSNNSNVRKKITRQRNMSLHKKDILSSNFRPIGAANNSINSTNNLTEKKKKVDDISLKKILHRNWWINLSIYLHEQSTLLIGGNSLNEDRILKGHMNVRSELERLIEKFDAENEDKYLILQKIRKERFSQTSISLGEIENEDLRKNSILSNRNLDVIHESGEEQVSFEIKKEFDDNIKENVNENTQQKREEILIQHDRIINQNEKQDSLLSSDTNILMTEIKNEDREEFLESTEYFELREGIVSEFFEKYCSKWKILNYIILHILKFFAQNFEYICFFVMLVNHMVYCSLLSVVWPLLVFCAGLINYPRPRKFFWKLSIIYCSFVICFKFILQLSFWTLFFEKTANADEYGSYNFKDHTRIGIELYNSTFCSKFFHYIIFDFILLSVLLAHQFMLIRKGLWSVIEPDFESVEQAYDRIKKNNPRSGEVNPFAKNYHTELNSADVDYVIAKEKNLTMLEKIKGYYAELFPRMRNEKPGKDFYVWYTIFQMFLMVYIIFFYTKMDQDTTVYNEETIKLKQFSGNMVIFSFLHVFLVVLERYIYLKNLRRIKNIKYKIYDAYTGQEIKPDDRRDSHQVTLEEMEDLKSYEENESFEVVYFQYESLQMGLIYKYILQIILVVFIHFFIFWYFPIRGNINLHNSSICEKRQQGSSICNEFKDNIFLKVFYIFYCIYFLFSGLQIRYSMIDLRKQSSLMQRDNLFYSSVFKTFKAMPFLYELKHLIDWTFTETALDLFKWLKFEAIYDLLFITKCNMKSYYARRLGSKVTHVSKFFSGGLFFFLLIIIVFGPLVLFSSLNPTNKPNLVTGASIELQLSFVKDHISLNYTLFTNSHVQSIELISLEEWQLNNFNEIVETKNFDKDQIQVVKMLSNSESNWDIPDDTFKFIVNLLDKKYGYDIYLNLKYSFTRELTPINNFYVSSYQIYPKNDTKTDFSLSKQILENLNKCYDNQTYFSGYMYVEDFYNSAIRLSSSPTPSLMTQDKNQKKSVRVVFNCDKYKSFWKLVKRESLNNEGILFYTFSDLVSPTSASYDVLTFYITFILIIGKFVRSYISGEAEKVIYTEMPRPHKLLKLCEGIKISRYKQDLEREDKLFYILIDLLRSPEMLRMITKSSLQFTLSTVADNQLVDLNTKRKSCQLNVKQRNKVLFY